MLLKLPMAVAVNQGFGLPLFFVVQGLAKDYTGGKTGRGVPGHAHSNARAAVGGYKGAGEHHVSITRPRGGGVHGPTKMAFFFEQKTWPIAYIQQEVPGGAS